MSNGEKTISSTVVLGKPDSYIEKILISFFYNITCKDNSV